MRLLLAALLSALIVSPVSAEGGSIRFRGAYYWGVEEEALLSCDTGKVYWITGDESVLAPLRKAFEAARARNASAKGGLVVDVTVLDLGKANDGFAMDYESVLKVLRVEIVSVELANGPCASECN